MNTIIDGLNAILWNYVLIYGLLGAGLFFTLRLGGIQLRHFGEMVWLVVARPAADSYGITPFQALSVSLASRVGTCNPAGVAVALTLGGPGAVFSVCLIISSGMIFVAVQSNSIAESFSGLIGIPK
ncbi:MULTISPECIES: alanine:cation symporter family protein [Falsihalocynthiibacter]|uniref:alanine:cation symporter family protein n=1 Tax=Falsihalocynthiibacter TaxID=2854182 RepID=UPI00300310D7